MTFVKKEKSFDARWAIIANCRTLISPYSPPAVEVMHVLALTCGIASTPHGISSTMSSHAFSNALFCLAAYNLSKLFWYLGVFPIPSYGLEISIPFHALIGYRGLKLCSHPVLFLAPHTILGSSLLTIYGLHLRGVENLIGIFFALVYLFAVHVVPERAGVPNRIMYGIPVNEFCILILLSSIVVASKHVEIAMKMVMTPLLAAAGMELIPVVVCILRKILNPQYVSRSPERGIDPDDPLSRNMVGYSGCPFARAVDKTELGYPPVVDHEE